MTETMAEALVYIGDFAIIIALILAKEVYDVKIINMPKKRRDVIKLIFFAGLFIVSTALVFIQEVHGVIHFTRWRARALLWVIATFAFFYLLISIRECLYPKVK